MKEQLANMTIIELVTTAHSYATSIQQIETHSAIVREMASRLEALNLAHIGAMKKLRSATSIMAIPEGWKLVPEQMHVDEAGIEAICDRCGNGGEQYGEFTDGLFWVGELSNDGVIKYGLNVASADYPDEGSITVYEFVAPATGEAS